MKKNIILLSAALLLCGCGGQQAEEGTVQSEPSISAVPPLSTVTSDHTPYAEHGALHVGMADGYTAPVLLDSYNHPYQLIGASSHGLQWYVYPKEGGYLEGSQNSMDETIQRGIQAASDLGMYVILDWHVLNYNPNDIKSQAKSFFSDYVSRYRSYDNILYEICNEPVNTPWYDGSGNDLYSYGTDLLKTIRSIDPDAIVICGTNTWSQDVDQVSSEPLNDPNVMYTLHFYAATHYSDLQNKLRTVRPAMADMILIMPIHG